MRRTTKDASELKAIILHNLRDQPGCDAIEDVDLEKIEVRQHGANWTVKDYHPASVPKDACKGALETVVPYLQAQFDMA